MTTPWLSTDSTVTLPLTITQYLAPGVCRYTLPYCCENCSAYHTRTALPPLESVTFTFVVAVGWTAEGMPVGSMAKLKVTVFSGDKIVRVWYATEGASNGGIGYFKTPGATNWTYVGGTYVVEPLPQ